MARTQQALAQPSRAKLSFDYLDMDYYLAWIMGRQIYAGSDADECLAAAMEIEDGDAASWQRAWQTVAERVEAEAHAALGREDRVGARAGYLRACSYYRAALFIMPPHIPTFPATSLAMQTCFQQAMGLFDSPIERVQVPFHTQHLPGYVWKVDASDELRPTVLVVGGIETFAEDCYFMVGHAGAERGYNVLTVDLPGQGETPNAGLVFGARMEIPLTAVIDAALRRPDVDPARLAVFGFSWGGHIVFKGGRYDPHIRTLIANPAMPNVFRTALAQQGGHNRRDPIARIVFDQIVWRMGLRLSLHPRDLARRLAKAYEYLVYGTVDPRKIPYPTLYLAGEGESPITLKIARECFAQLPHPQKKLVIFTQDEGGAAHCQVNNLALPNRVIFDWLDAVFA